jgi:uncharacterized protein (DUF302 family)
MTPLPVFAVILALVAAVAVARPSWSTGAADEAGRVRIKSPHTVDVTLDRAETALRDKGLKVVTRIDHAAAAREAGLELPPIVVLIFGNPRVGSPTMTANPLAAIDLPLKALVYQDKDGQTWFAYNSADYFYGTIMRRHGARYPEDAPSRYAKLMSEVAAKTAE